MPEPYEIVFRPEVEDDLRPLGKLLQRRVLSAMDDRLATEPHEYGKPLGGNLAGLRRIRVGDLRVAYQVKGHRVVVWAVMHRKAVYGELVRRFLR